MTWGGSDEDAGAPDPGAAQHRCGVDARAEAAGSAAVDLADGIGPSARQRRAGVPSGERGRRSGAANQRLAGPVRHHPGRRPARGDPGRRGRCGRHSDIGRRLFRRRSTTGSVRLPPADADPADGSRRCVPDR